MFDKRRKLILAAGLTVFSGGPSRAAPPPGRTMTVGVLLSTSEPESRARHFLAEPLRIRGYVEGRNLHFEWRYAENRYERLDALAADLAARKVDVIFAGGTPPTLAASRATSTIPILSVGATNPVSLGLAGSLSRPGGNVTGVVNMAAEVVRKGVEILKQLAPSIRRVGFLMNPENPASMMTPAVMADMSKRYGTEVVGVPFRVPGDLETELGKGRRDRVDAVYIRLDSKLNAHSDAFARFTREQRLPSMGSVRQYVPAGGLASYGQSYEEMYAIAAEYVDRIANGASAADLPIIQPSKFELALNRTIASELGITIAPELLLRADSVIG